jgi:hypothetical protein
MRIDLIRDDACCEFDTILSEVSSHDFHRIAEYRSVRVLYEACYVQPSCSTAVSWNTNIYIYIYIYIYVCVCVCITTGTESRM